MSQSNREPVFKLFFWRLSVFNLMTTQHGKQSFAVKVSPTNNIILHICTSFFSLKFLMAAFQIDHYKIMFPTKLNNWSHPNLNPIFVSKHEATNTFF